MVTKQEFLDKLAELRNKHITDDEIRNMIDDAIEATTPVPEGMFQVALNVFCQAMDRLPDNLDEWLMKTNRR